MIMKSLNEQNLDNIMSNVNRKDFLSFYCAYYHIDNVDKFIPEVSGKSLPEIIMEEDTICACELLNDYFGFYPLYLPYYKDAFKNGNLYIKDANDEKLYKVYSIDFFDSGEKVVSSQKYVLVNSNLHTYMTYLYIKTDKFCPTCGKPLYKSDVLGYDYVCLECDENLDECEI